MNSNIIQKSLWPALLTFLVASLVAVTNRLEPPSSKAPATVVSTIAQSVVSQDLSELPYNPAPWTIPKNHIVDGTGKVVSTAGVNVNGYANLPTTKSQATTRAKKAAYLGIRVLRAHHMDGPLLDNPQAHGERFQWWLDSLKKLRIPAIIEFASSQFDKDKLARGDPVETAKWRAYVAQVCKLDLSNVVAACPVNEPSTTSEKVFQEQYDWIRKCGFKGLIFGSNSMVQGGPQGDFANGHFYCGLEGQRDDEFFEIEYKDQRWNHPKSQALPVVATEIGHFWPASTRYQSEWQIIESLRAVKAQVICMFAWIDNDDEWTAAKKPIDKDSFHNDPDRLETLARLAHLMAGVDYLPRTFTPGFKASKVEGGKWKIGAATAVAK